MRVRFIVYYENSYEKHFERPRVADSGITLYPYSDLRTVGVDTTSACQVIENDKLIFVPSILSELQKRYRQKTRLWSCTPVGPQGCRRASFSSIPL